MAQESKLTKIKSFTDGIIPPHSIESEIAVLGAMLLSNQVTADIISQFAKDTIKKDEEKKLTNGANVFYDPRHKVIYTGIVELFNRNIASDIISLGNQLQQNGTLDEAGGTHYLLAINNKVPTYAYYQNHSQIIQRYYFKRCLIDAATKMLENSQAETIDAFDAIDDAEAEIFRISEARLTNKYKDMNTIYEETYQDLMKQLADPQNTSAVTTNYRYLDNKLNGGLQKSDLIILASRPSMGKTAFALALTYNAAKKGIPVGFFSLEMSARQLVVRLINLDINYAKAETQMRTVQSIIKQTTDATKKAHQEFIESATKSLPTLPIYIDDTAAISIMELRAKCRRMKAEKNVGLIVVDYLQLIRSPKAETREREIAIISSTLKQIARELDVPVLALAQLNRLFESRIHGGKDIDFFKTPVLSDLRESGSIEQDADVVMFIHRPEAVLKNDPDKDTKIEAHNLKNIAQIVLEKHRNGETGKVDLNCFIDCGVFTHKDNTFNSANIQQNNNYQNNTNQQYTPPQNNIEDKPF
ncbi:MAG: replicative DNA helicase [Bacteroidetes bacterium]|nr:replicative DNA helicase [Bacteroidota bacterium]